MVVTLGQQYNTGEKLSVMLYAYKNRHAGTPDKNKTKTLLVCVGVFSSHLFWTSNSLDVPAGVTQEEGHTGFFTHLPSAVRALIFLARRIQPFLSIVDRKVEFCVLIVLHLLGIYFLLLSQRVRSLRGYSWATGATGIFISNIIQ